jgi:hypothetical protein
MVPLRARNRSLVTGSSIRQIWPMKQEFVFQIEQDEDMLVATCHE